MLHDEPSRHRIYIQKGGSMDRELLEDILEERELGKKEIAKLKQDFIVAQDSLTNYKAAYPQHKHKFLFWKI